MVVTKEKLLKIANEGQWEYSNNENRCKHCGRYDWENSHDDNCSLRVLLKLIEKSDWE